jgi:hypothetical protein
MIRQAAAAAEPGGGRLIELLQCFMRGPAEQPSSVTPGHC